MFDDAYMYATTPAVAPAYRFAQEAAAGPRAQITAKKLPQAQASATPSAHPKPPGMQINT